MSFLSLSTDLVTQAYPDQPLAVSGDATVGEVVERLRLYAQAGASRVYLQVLDLTDIDHLELVAAEAAPHL